MRTPRFLTANWWRGPWSAPAVSALLIIVGFTLERLGGGAGNVGLLDGWLFVSGGHTHAMSPEFALGDLMMVLAATVAGWRILSQAIRGLISRHIGIDLLVSVAAIGAILIGNFWEAAAVTFLFSLGNALEAATLNKTRSALSELVAVAPNEATVLTDSGAESIPARLVERGQIVLVKAGGKVPVDGFVTSGRATIDEATITGESLPVEKAPGDKVFAGTISRGGLIEVEATGVGADTTLARIVRRVEEAQDAKAPTQALIDRISRWYTPAVMVVALATGLITGDIVLALTLLVIACPGALVISIPVAVVAGIGRAARDGILIKGGEFLETSAKVDAVALDKTGTLTQNRPTLTDVVVLADAMTKSDLLGIVAHAEAGSDHPLARPVVDGAKRAGVAPTAAPDNVVTVAGKGIVARIGTSQVLVGNAGLLSDHQVAGSDLDAARSVAADLASRGRTAMLVAIDGYVAGVLGVVDQVRSTAAEMVADLRNEGVKRVVMLTGDAPLVAEAVGSEVGLDRVYASLLPEDKLAVVEELRFEGFTVAMIGDGVNDAPALAVADIGVAMGAAGSAVATETADIALMADDLLKVPQAIDLAKRTRRVMVQNMWIAFLTVGFLLVGVFGGAVTMALGMALHEASVLVVILNAMRLLRVRRSARPREESAGICAPESGALDDLELPR